MHKLTIIAAATALAVFTGAAQAQRTASPNYKAPNPTPAAEYHCADQLGLLRRVYEEELDAVQSPERVWVTPICEGEDSGPIRNAGNSGALRAHIAQNPAMLEALFASNFDPEDVVGIYMMGEDAVTLYVHPFHP